MVDCTVSHCVVPAHFSRCMRFNFDVQPWTRAHDGSDCPRSVCCELILLLILERSAVEGSTVPQAQPQQVKARGLGCRYQVGADTYSRSPVTTASFKRLQLSPAVLPISAEAEVTIGSEGAHEHHDPRPPSNRGRGFDALLSASARCDKQIATARAEHHTWRSSHGEEDGAWRACFWKCVVRSLPNREFLNSP
jgi:hypothetical protein